MFQCGVAAADVGVIAVYNEQVRLIRDMLVTSSRRRHQQQQVDQREDVVSDADVEVNTVDQYQGRDKSVIIVSFVRHDVSAQQVRGSRQERHHCVVRAA